MNTFPKLGLVTVLYNGIEVLEGFFESLSKQTYTNYVLYVIDNSPNDDALNEAMRLSNDYAIPVEFINNNANFGVAKGNNQGIFKALEEQCDYILLLNNDIEFPEETISLMVDYAQVKHEPIIVPKIYYYGTSKLWMAGGEILTYSALTPMRGNQEEDVGQYDHIEYIGFAPTCFMLLSCEVFHKVGMMDEKYFVYYDDTDFIYRAQLAGYKIVYFPQAIVQHKVSISTGGANSLFSIYYTTRNRLYFIGKNFNLMQKMISLFYFYSTRIIKYVQYGSKERKELVRALMDGWKLLKS